MRSEHFGFGKDYSKRSFWKKLDRHAKTAGREVVEIALKLYYAAESPETPKWAKATIYGALVYLITPVDVTPDPIPVIGYVDDLFVLLKALAIIAIHITPDIAEKAKHKASYWFGDKEEAPTPQSAP